MLPILPWGFEAENDWSSVGIEAEFSPTEVERLNDVRSRYSNHHDLFTDRELARLHFIRWLVQTGRLEA